LANKEGYIFKSNVNTVEEMANMMSASRSYQNNIEVLNTAKQMMLQTLKMGQ
jgi:flagellar basal-body rod protein FlgC